ncbi:hypothetical protein FEM03_20865 [Phragmitibacter flavus]|uniref:nicotinate-nucleotide adenylyltransferase n=1 Tax=Phragmitibacter flavus TaxID=2576071 RepID=A0A5R8K8Z7_9BACT|nr:NAD(+)/NADH kinase [Phragmitibacter flavus]TLD68788.1 hypothetical protein FEM03_20865 [Phragmitibacter flavus]
MPRRIALFGGSFNPPGLHHRQIAELLSKHFDEVLVVPCGPRPDKPDVTNVPSVSRAALCDITFEGIPNTSVELFDLEQETFTRNHALETLFAHRGEIWHVVGADWLTGGAIGKSAIHTGWEKGEELWHRSHFAVLTRPGHPLNPADLPPHHQLLPIEIDGSSTQIREILIRGGNASHLLTSRAHRYISRYGLYRGNNPASWSRGSLSDWNHQIQADLDNTKAQGWIPDLVCHADSTNPDFILTLGGDGTMLRAIREHWRRRLPFFGVNAGTLGFLMNAPEAVFESTFPPTEVIFRQLPLLYLEIQNQDGTLNHVYAFNDAWVERSSSQSAWLEVEVNDVPRLPRLVSDGVLVSTAAGSTAYARSMGSAPLLADTPAWLLVGSNVQEPVHWKSALLSTDSHIAVRNLSPEKRPITAYVDGISQGPAIALRARLSRAATVELVFLASHDMAEKIAGIQFMN